MVTMLLFLYSILGVVTVLLLQVGGIQSDPLAVFLAGIFFSMPVWLCSVGGEMLGEFLCREFKRPDLPPGSVLSQGCYEVFGCIGAVVGAIFSLRAMMEFSEIRASLAIFESGNKAFDLGVTLVEFFLVLLEQLGMLAMLLILPLVLTEIIIAWFTQIYPRLGRHLNRVLRVPLGLFSITIGGEIFFRMF